MVALRYHQGDALHGDLPARSAARRRASPSIDVWRHMTDSPRITDAQLERVLARLLPKLVEPLKQALIADLTEPLSIAVEARMKERFYATAGKGIFNWVWKLWKPILFALIIYGLTLSPAAQKVYSIIEAAKKQ